MQNKQITIRHLSAKALGPRLLRLGLLTLCLCASASAMAETTPVAAAAETPPAATLNTISLLDQLKGHQAAMKGEKLPVAMLMQAISRQTGLNIFVASNIDDTININMENLSLYDVFQLMVDTKKLHVREKNNIIMVEKATDALKDAEEQTTANVCTKYSDATKYLDQLKSILGKGGSITASNRGACLIVHDQPANIEKVRKILTELDQPIPQVHIEARIVSLSQEAKRLLGIKWGYDNLSSRNSIKAGANLSLAGTTSNLTIGFLRDNLQLDFDLRALQQDNKLRILSAPRVLVLDGKKAEIKQGKEVPYVSSTTTTINTSFREANLSLKVTPNIMQEDYIVLDLEVTNDSVDQSSGPVSSGTGTGTGTDSGSAGQLLINKQSINTSLFLENNLTVVIGGILEQTADNKKSGVPGLSKIPLLGLLFSNTEKRNEEKELLVFITPTIVTMPSMLKASEALLAKQGPLKDVPAGQLDGLSQEKLKAAEKDAAGNPPDSPPERTQ